MLNFPFRMLSYELRETFFPAASLSPLCELAQQEKVGISTCLTYNQHLYGVFHPVVHGVRLIHLEGQESLEGSVAGEKTVP